MKNQGTEKEEMPVVPIALPKRGLPPVDLEKRNRLFHAKPSGAKLLNGMRILKNP